MKLPCAILLPILFGLCCSCNQQTDPKKKSGEAHMEIVAQVGNERITAAEFQAEWNQRWRGVPGVQATSEQRERLLEEMVREKATLAKARAAGLERSPETVVLIDRLIVARYTEAEFARRFPSEPVVDEAEIAGFYENKPVRFQIAPAVRAGFIFLKLGAKADQTQRANMLERANTLRSQAASADASTFKSLVQQHSEDQATRYTGGDTGWLREGQPASCDPAVLAAALQLQHPGDAAPVVAAANGFYIVRLLERQSAGSRPLAEVSEAIRYELQQQKRQQREQEFFSEMKRGLKIEVNEAVLKSISTSNKASAATPPPLPGS